MTELFRSGKNPLNHTSIDIARRSCSLNPQIAADR